MQTQNTRDDKIGAALLKLQNDEADPMDVRYIIDQLITSDKFRSRCPLIGRLLNPPQNNIEKANREEQASSLFVMVLCRDPGYSALGAYVSDKVTHRGKKVLSDTPHKWLGHYDEEENSISLDLYGIACAVEDLWGVRNVLVHRSK